MGMFNKILGKLGLKKQEEAAPATPKSGTPSNSVYGSYAKSAEAARMESEKKAASAPKKAMMDRSALNKAMDRSQNLANKLGAGEEAAAPMAMVDVMSKLEEMAKGTGLNWRQSIVDLLKVLGLDSSYAARKELAQELGCPAEYMNDSVKMNTWLHKTVLQKIAENGGNIPSELLD